MKNHGLAYFIDAVSQAKQPGFKKYLIGPIVINILVFLLIWFGAIHCFNHWVATLKHHLPHYLQWLSTIVWWGFVVLLIIISGYFFSLIAGIIGAPFYGLLAEKTQVEHTHKAISPMSWNEYLMLIPRTFSRVWQWIIYALPRFILVLLITLIPGLNMISGVVWLIFGAWMITIQTMDYALELHELPFKHGPRLLKHQPKYWMGLGLTTQVLMWIPIINLIALPIAVIGATCMANDLLEQA